MSMGTEALKEYREKLYQMIKKPSTDKVWLNHYDKNIRNETIPNTNFYDLVYQNNIHNMNGIAINYFGKRINFAEFFNEVDRVARSFISMGVKKGDLVTVAMPSTPEVAYAFFALNKIGAVSHMIDPRISAHILKNYIDEANSKILVTVDLAKEKFKDIVGQTNIEKVVISPVSESFPAGLKLLYNAKEKLKHKNKFVDDRFIDWNVFLEGSKKVVGPIDCECNVEDDAAIVYTSGTTGVPKGAVLSNKVFVSIGIQQKYAMPSMKKNDKFLDIMPPFISYGIVCGLFLPFYVGMETIMIPQFKPEEFAKLIRKWQPNHAIGVPSFWESLLNSKELKEIPYIINAISGGDGMKVAAEIKLNEFFQSHSCNKKIAKGYGLTEMGSVATVTIGNEHNELGSVGLLLPFNNIKIVDSDTKKELGYNEYGEIYLTGPTMISRYLNNPEETEKVFEVDENGVKWVKTGDVGCIDEKGYIKIVNRIKRMIIRPDGHNVFPSNIENVISKHPAVKDCAVIGMPNGAYENGSIPTAFIVLHDEYKGKEDAVIKEIIDLQSSQLPFRDVALEHHFRDFIPMTSVGKVDFQKIKEEALKYLEIGDLAEEAVPQKKYSKM